MCGIVGIVATTPIDPDAVAAANAALAHRGPDDRGTWRAPHGRAALGHTRLAIIDPAGGRQPIASESGRIVITVNGELYGFEEIRRRLERSGHRFRTGSDSEIALHLYEEKGLDFVSELRGEFALVLWDEDRERLVAVRDRCGVKPLYYAHHGDGLFLASEAKALFAAGVPCRWDGWGYYANTLLPFPRQGLFANVQPLPPGHLLVSSRGEETVSKYWDLDFPRAVDAAANDDGDWEARFAATLDEAVRLRLRADVPVGCYLSGGVDSAGVLALAMARATVPLAAFTYCCSTPGFDEEAPAREVAFQLGAPFHPLHLDDAELAASLAEATRIAELPSHNAHGAARFLLGRFAREHGCKVVLTGEGADELLAGYAQLELDRLLAAGGDPAETDVAIAALRHRNPTVADLLVPAPASAELAPFSELLGFVPSWIANRVSGGRRVVDFFLDEGFAADHRARRPAAEFLAELDVEQQIAGRRPLDQVLYLWSKTMLPNVLLRLLGDGAEMAHGVEGRLPYLDHRLIELASRLPEALKTSPESDKVVLRRALADRLEPAARARPKKSFLLPPSAVRPGPLQDLLQETLRGPALDGLPFLDRGRILNFLDFGLPHITDPQMVQSVDKGLMWILTTAILQQSFRPSPPR
jgi:asparagine synthase (glutamine-hydrolysing)